MPKSTPKTAPEMMLGRVIAQRVRCGKASCKCAKDGLHRAFYRYWTEGGRQRKAYVRHRDLDATREACAKWAEAERATRAILDGADADRTRAEVRANVRAALGEQIDTPGGRRELRRLRSRGKARAWQRPDPLEVVADESLVLCNRNCCRIGLASCTLPACPGQHSPSA